MAKKHADTFKPDDRNAQELAQAALTQRLTHGGTFRETLETHINIEQKSTGKSQEQLYGLSDYRARAQAVLNTLNGVAEGRMEFLHAEKNALADAGKILQATAKCCQQLAVEALTDTTGRKQSSGHGFLNRSKDLKRDIAPLLEAMARKLGITLDSPGQKI